MERSNDPVRITNCYFSLFHRHFGDIRSEQNLFLFLFTGIRAKTEFGFATKFCFSFLFFQAQPWLKPELWIGPHQLCRYPSDNNDKLKLRLLHFRTTQKQNKNSPIHHNNQDKTQNDKYPLTRACQVTAQIVFFLLYIAALRHSFSQHTKQTETGSNDIEWTMSKPETYKRPA